MAWRTTSKRSRNREAVCRAPRRQGALKFSPDPRRSRRDKREAEHRSEPKASEERSGYALLAAVAGIFIIYPN